MITGIHEYVIDNMNTYSRVDYLVTDVRVVAISSRMTVTVTMRGQYGESTDKYVLVV